VKPQAAVFRIHAWPVVDINEGVMECKEGWGKHIHQGQQTRAKKEREKNRNRKVVRRLDER
jgi:hypothetical protein